MLQALVLFMAALFAAIVNSVAGGGAIMIYPLLLAFGLPPVTANATTSVTVLPGLMSSAYAYRQHIKTLPRRYFYILFPCLIGGLLGGFLLGITPNATFETIVPWFMAFAVGLIILQPKIHKWLDSRQGKDIVLHHRALIWAIIVLSVTALAIYGGYFGVGFGIVMLAFLGLTPLTDIAQMNGLKNLATIFMNATAVVYFIVIGIISWHLLPFLLLGSAIGGWIGATYSQKLPTKTIRVIIILIGVLVSLYLFAKIYI